MSASRRRSRSQSSTPNNSPRPPPLSGLPAWSYTPLSERMTTSTPPTPSVAPYPMEFFPSSRPAASSSSSTNYSLFGGELNQENLVRLHREAYVSLRRSVAESDDNFVERMRNWERTRSLVPSTIGRNEGSSSQTDGTAVVAVDLHAQPQYLHHQRLQAHSHKRRKTTASETRAGPLDDFSHRHSHARHSQSSSHPRRHRWPHLPQTRKRRGFESDADSSSTPDDDDEYRAASIPSCHAVSFTWDEDTASNHSDAMEVEGPSACVAAPALSMSMSSGSSTSLPCAEPFTREDKAIEELNLAMAAGAGSIDDYEDVRKAQGELEEVDAGALWD